MGWSSLNERRLSENFESIKFQAWNTSVMKKEISPLSSKSTGTLLVAVAFLLALLIPRPGAAQGHFSVELRGGAAFPTENLGNADLDVSPGFEALLAYRFIPYTSIYAGWGYASFSASESFAGSHMDFVETGYTFGFQFTHKLGIADLNYMLRAGAVSNHIEVEDAHDNIIADSGHGLGWQIEAGLEIPLIDHLMLTPAVRYRSLSRELTIGEITTDVDLRYVFAGVGVAYTF